MIRGENQQNMLLLNKTKTVGRKSWGIFLCPICNKEVERRLDAGVHQKSCGKCRPFITRHPAYSIWEGMKQRCYNPNVKNYRWYGAKGVSICAEWKSNSFAFVTWAESSGYREGLTIDRIDNTKGYSPENCQWLTRVENLEKDRGKRISWAGRNKYKI